MRLIHYSDAELQALYSVPQDDEGVYRYRSFGKPRGLWVSVEGEDDWPHWCERTDWPCGGIATEIMLAPDAKVLRISDEDGIDRFTDRYSVVECRTRNYIQIKIDWAKAAEDHHGLIIAPYCLERRLSKHTGWYHAWDCASGCIWNMDAVSGFRDVQAMKKARQLSPTGQLRAGEGEGT